MTTNNLYHYAARKILRSVGNRDFLLFRLNSLGSRQTLPDLTLSMSMFKTVVSTFCTLVSASLAVELNNVFKSLSIDRYFALILSVVIASIVHKILEFILSDVPLKFRFTRNLIDQISTIEGYWYEEVDVPNHPFTYVCIEYDIETRGYTYYGSNYYKDFNLNATFKSINVRIERSSNSLHFHFKAQVFKQKQPQISGYGLITFYKDGNNSFTRGEGNFIDNNGFEIKERRFILCKINPKQVKEILGKNTLVVIMI